MATPVTPQTRLIAASAFVAAVIGGGLIATRGGPSAPYTASGTVQCASGTPPVGVWVSAPHGDAGWASLKPDRSDPAIGHFSRPIAHGGDYAVNVGCGGTPEKWGINATSEKYREGEVHLMCNDRPTPLGQIGRWIPPLDWTNRGGTAYGRCHRIQGPE
jgi:hypothetical protein